ncbi:LacI family DNA-binding transcriptional regulator [Bifidobacterium sp. B4001]|uniref:LacI family DNA-binding transcriptional regulator n=1 Tax=Bifidobacterium sp. B4001 TaxID=2817961 RepID=UPI00226B8273|nr:LacI family DNA-binding transcriptional regulator [Bifidobacterium sp. B4001]MCX8673240.1 LacI family DNA-binding transcriptional regulator [Bifidobacterium sp. B4079]MCX8681673.1 LacI family DNA-binding transcriptional regulator [Bifidobacterium sp. B4001]
MEEDSNEVLHHNGIPSGRLLFGNRRHPLKSTIQDVARKAGVSVSTVSRSFTRPQLVSAKTRAKVLTIARQLDFSISRSAAALKSGQSMRIAMLISDSVTKWFNSHVFAGLNDVLQQSGYDISIYTMNTFEARSRFFSDLPVRRNADAVVVCSFNIEPDEIARLGNMDVPIVGINIPAIKEFDAAVYIDDRDSMRLAVNHLIGLGHRRIAFIRAGHGSPFRYRADERLEGFMDACRKADIQDEATAIQCPLGQDVYNSALSQLLALEPAPTAVCFQTDELAIPILYRLHRYGREVPDDLSVIGFDDSTYSDAIGLTTIQQDPYAMGRAAADKILSLITGKDAGELYQMFPTHLILRDTTKPPR